MGIEMVRLASSQSLVSPPRKQDENATKRAVCAISLTTFSRLCALGRPKTAPAPCGSQNPRVSPTPQKATVALRDWEASPPTLDLPLPSHANGAIYALSDVHGDCERMVEAMCAQKLTIVNEKKKTVWNAGATVVLVLGDLIDKGPDSLGVVATLMDLQKQAHLDGGMLIALCGNHEGEFLSNPRNSKASDVFGINRELARLGKTPERFIYGDDDRAVWLRNLPFAAKVGPYFFSHSGNSQGRSMDSLQAAIKQGGDEDGYGTDILMGENGILDARLWWHKSRHTAQKNANHLGVSHIIFGHDPNVFGEPDEIGTGKDNLLVRIDCGMSRGINLSRGSLLKLTWDKDVESGLALRADGKTKLLWRQPLPKAACVFA